MILGNIILIHILFFSLQLSSDRGESSLVNVSETDSGALDLSSGSRDRENMKSRSSVASHISHHSSSYQSEGKDFFKTLYFASTLGLLAFVFLSVRSAVGVSDLQSKQYNLKFTQHTGQN